jgi:hypothetical protein
MIHLVKSLSLFLLHLLTFWSPDFTQFIQIVHPASHQMGAAGSLSMFPPSGGPAFGRHSIAPIGFIQQQQQQQTTAAASALAGSQQQPQWQQPEMAQRGEQVHLGNVYRWELGTGSTILIK